MVFKNKTFLVTGGAGFIGSHTTDALIKREARVVIVDNVVTGRKENLNSKAKFYKLDCVSPRLTAIFKKEKPDFVFHFAFNVLVPKSVDDPLMDAQSIIASLNVIKNSHRFGVKKIIFSSSGFIYGNRAPRPTAETAPLDPVSPYAISKYTVENYLRYYGRTFGLPYVIVRYATVYGPRQVLGAMADYIHRLAVGKQAKMWGDGSKTRDYVFIEDAVKANLAVLALGDDFDEPVFNVGSGRERPLNEVYQMIAKLVGKEPRPTYLPDRPGEQLGYSLNASKINNALGWRPRVSFANGLKQTVNDYLISHSLPRRFGR